MVLFDDAKVVWIHKFCVAIARTSHQHRVVVCDVQGENFTLVNGRLSQNLRAFNVILDKFSVLSRDNDGLIFWSPHGLCENHIFFRLKLVNVFWGVRIKAILQIVDADVAQLL